MQLSELPVGAELTVGPVTLPAARLIVAGYGSGKPVAWATTLEVPDPGLAWAADVLPLIGWDGACNWHRNPLPIAAVLRSWEDRFGARLLEIGFDEISLMVSRPPRSIEAARAVAAEHFVFCDECGGEGHIDVSGITAELVSEPIWTFWWD